MNIFKGIKIWLTDLLCISNYDRKVERKFWKMHRLYEKGGENFQIRHPMGIMIGPTAVIGDIIVRSIPFLLPWLPLRIIEN